MQRTALAALALSLALSTAALAAGVGSEVAYPPTGIRAADLPANVLEPMPLSQGETGLLLAQASYNLTPADYSTRIADWATHAMGAYVIPATEAKTYALNAPAITRILTPEVAGLNSELGHLLMAKPSDMGLNMQSMFDVPMVWKQLDTMSQQDFRLNAYGDGMREVWKHLQ